MESQHLDKTIKVEKLTPIKKKVSKRRRSSSATNELNVSEKLPPKSPNLDKPLKESVKPTPKKRKVSESASKRTSQSKKSTAQKKESQAVDKPIIKKEKLTPTKSKVTRTKSVRKSASYKLSSETEKEPPTDVESQNIADKVTTKNEKATSNESAVNESEISCIGSHEEESPKKKFNIHEKTMKSKYEKYAKDNKWKLVKVPHQLLPSFNINKFTDIHNVRNMPLLEVSLPHSVFVSSTQQPGNVDLCHRRTIALNSFLFRLKSIRTAYLTAKKNCKQIRKDEKKGIFNSTLIEFASKKDNNPDKYFARDFDFYYTSGNLRVNQETNQILHASGKNLEKLSLSEFNVSNGIPSVVQIASLDLKAPDKKESEIFEMDFSRSQSENSFFVRRKFSISLHQYSDNKFKLLRMFRSKNVPLISFAQDKVNTNHLAISNLDHNIRIYDLEKNVPKEVLKPMLDEFINPALTWNMIRSWDRQVYVYANCRKIHIIDTRLRESEWRSNYCGFDDESYCASFCSLTLSKFSNLFYMGSNHKMYCVDKRFMSRNIEDKNTTVSRWTHQMTSSPLMMATSCNDNCENIILQSPASSDMRLCENIRSLNDGDHAENGSTKTPHVKLPSKYVYKSPCLPYMPESLQNIFNQAQRQGKCLKPDTGMLNRIKACITGLDFVGDSSNPYILTATSHGDIFARHMHKPNDGVKYSTAVKVMSHFESNIYSSVRKTPLEITRLCDLSGIKNVFRYEGLSNINPVQDDFFNIPNKRKYLGRWQKSIGTLFKYKDALVNDLLSIWEVEDVKDEQPLFNGNSLLHTSVADVNSLVCGWLENTPDLAHSTMNNMTSIPMDVFSSSSAFVDTSLEITRNINESQGLLDQTISSAPKSKPSKKKSRYIKGF